MRSLPPSIDGLPRFQVRDQGPQHVNQQPVVGDVVLLGAGLLMVRDGDGARYFRLCTLHQWASVEFYQIDGGTQCPFCGVDFEAGRGRERYRELHTWMAAPVPLGSQGHGH